MADFDTRKQGYKRKGDADGIILRGCESVDNYSILIVK